MGWGARRIRAMVWEVVWYYGRALRTVFSRYEVIFVLSGGACVVDRFTNPMVWYGMVWYVHYMLFMVLQTLWYGMVWYGMVWEMVWYYGRALEWNSSGNVVGMWWGSSGILVGM